MDLILRFSAPYTYRDIKSAREEKLLAKRNAFTVKDKKNMLPFQFYRSELMRAWVSRYHGDECIVKTFVIGDFAVKNRNPSVLEDFLLKKKMLNKVRIGKTKWMLVGAKDAVQCARKMAEEKVYFYNNIVQK